MTRDKSATLYLQPSVIDPTILRKDRVVGTKNCFMGEDVNSPYVV